MNVLTIFVSLCVYSREVTLTWGILKEIIDFCALSLPVWGACGFDICVSAYVYCLNYDKT